MREILDQYGDPARRKDCPGHKTDDMPNAGLISPQPCSPPKPQICPEKKWYQTIDGVRLFLEFVMFIVAIGYGVIYLEQMRAARDQAKAAQDQLAAMHDQQILDQRPWIGVGKPGLDKSGSNVPGIFFFQVKNSGKTPAFIFGTPVRLEVFENPSGFQIISKNVPMDVVAPTLAPGDEMSLPIQCNIPETNTANMLTTDKARMRLIIEIRYFDVFSRRHHTKIVFVYAPGNPTIPSDFMTVFGTAEMD